MPFDRLESPGHTVNYLARLFARALPAGTYFVAVGASGPTEVELSLKLEPPTKPADDQGCAAPPPIAAGVSQVLELGDHENSIASSCRASIAQGVSGCSFTTRSRYMRARSASFA